MHIWCCGSQPSEASETEIIEPVKPTKMVRIAIVFYST